MTPRTQEPKPLQKFTFSGHESFVCKQFWLKKGYDFVFQGHKFNQNSAVSDLGVGKNMVSSIRFWMKSFGMLDEQENLTDLAHYIFGEDGRDPFLEDNGTIWLLHYQLVKCNHASIYNIVFNEFRKEHFEFRREQLFKYLLRLCEDG